MKRFILAACMFALVGCANVPTQTLHKERNLSGVTITWVRDNNISAVMGDLNTCTIHAPEPEYVADNEKMAAIGYAAMHCFYGGFNAIQKVAISDNPQKIRRTMNMHTMYVDWIRTKPSFQDGGVCHAPHSIGGGSYSMGEQNLGCEEMTGIDSCMIYVMEPSSENDRRQLEKIGHEIVHCFLGEFHN